MRTILTRRPWVGAIGLIGLIGLVGACGADEADPTDVVDDRPTVVVSTSVWGDVIENLLGDAARVEVLMPLGTDPHDFSPSARQAEQMEEADLVVVNGLGLEEGLAAVIENVADTGTPVLTVADAIVAVDDRAEPYDGHDEEDDGHDDEHDDEHDGDDEHDDEHDEHDDGHDAADDSVDDEHDHGAVDPHLWMDPVAVADAAPELASEIAAQIDVDSATVERRAEAYVERLRTLDDEIAARLADVPSERRLLVTNHDALRGFAERYELEVLGSIIPANTTNAEPSAADLDELTDRMRASGAPAIFVETTESDRLARAVADSLDDVLVVELYTGSLGGPGTGAESFIGLHALNADRIADALG